MTHPPDARNRALADKLFGAASAIPSLGALPSHVGRYRVLGKLGSGGMGLVLEGEGPQGRRVAIKLLTAGSGVSERARLRFQREARALAAIRHPNVACVLELGEHEGAPFFVMDLYPGGALADLLEGPALPSVERVAQLGVSLASGLAAAHARGILHRDLKPENVLFSSGGEPVLCDFGLTKNVDPSVDSRVLTRSGCVMGTPGFFAPEQASTGGRPMTAATDVYGLGATLYALLTGRPPIIGESLVEVVVATQGQAPPSIRSLRPGVDPGLEAIVLRCLNKEPSERWASASELGAALRGYLSGEPARSAAAGPASGWVWAGWVLLGLVLLGLVLLVISPGPPTPMAGFVQGVLPSLRPTGPAGSRGPARELVERARAGDRSAMTRLADSLSAGSGEDPRAAAEWYLRAAEAGEVDAMSAVGSLYAAGRGFARDEGRAADWHRKAAGAGSVRSMKALARLAHEPRDKVAWLERAAGLGDPEGMCLLGTAYMLGEGVPPDLAKAERWLRRSADKGSAAGAGRLGVLLSRRPAPDMGEVVRWIRMGAEGGDSLAMNALGMCYASGRGLGKNRAAALRWYRRGAAAGSTKAMNNLGVELALRDRAVEAATWFRRAAEAQDSQGMFNFGVALKEGYGLEKNRGAARTWLTRAAQAGHVEAMQALGGLIEAQEGPNSPLATLWFERAKARGYRGQEATPTPGR